MRKRTASTSTAASTPRSTAATFDDDDRPVGGRPSRNPDGTHRDARRAVRDQRGRRAEPAAAARHPGHGRLRGSVVPLGAVGPRRRLPGQAVRARSAPGASGFQIAPTIADDVEQLTVFQRTAQWMFPNANYHRARARRRAVGDAPPAVLRAVVPLPHLLSRAPGCQHRALAHRSRLRRRRRRSISESNRLTARAVRRDHARAARRRRPSCWRR